MIQKAIGGSGGYGAATGGAGGTALSQLVVAQSGASSIAGSAIAVGGAGGGGAGLSAGGDAVSAAGAAAVASANVVGSGNVAVSAVASGGNGGNGGYGTNAGYYNVYANGGNGGGGGSATLGNVYGESTGGGSVSVNGTLSGGAGGNGGAATSFPSFGSFVGNGGNGGNGQDAVLYNTVSGSTAGSLTLNQTAIGGNGGYGGSGLGLGGAGGKAGNASSSLTLTQMGVNRLAVNTTATGGNGVIGGYALATSDVTGNGSTNASATATGGNGGNGGNVYKGGAGGNAIANASATGIGMVSSYANAAGGYGGTAYGGFPDGPAGSASALADAIGSGSGNSLAATAQCVARGGIIVGVTATATSPIFTGATSHSEAFAEVGAAPRPESMAAGLQAAAFANGLPNGEGTSDFFGTMALAAASAGASGTPQTYSSEIDWTIKIADSSEPLLVGFSGAQSIGDGTVEFKIVQNGTAVLDDSFASFAAGDAFFQGANLNLGAIDAGLSAGQNLQLNFILSVTTGEAGAVFDPTVGFGSSLTLTTPEPASFAILAIAGAGMLLLKRRGGEQRNIN